MDLLNLDLRLPKEPFTVFLLTFFLLSGRTVSSQSLQSFTEIYEPSGVIQTSNGAVLIVEDEGKHPLFISAVIATADGLNLEPHRITATSFAARDLEGIAEGKAGEIFLITSHSMQKKGKQKNKRQQLVKFDLEEQQISAMQSFDQLLSHIQEHLEKRLQLHQKATKEVNIEGLAFTATKNELLVGLRAPLYDDKAILLNLVNPYDLFHKQQEPVFSDQILLLDLNGAGIRAIDYDKHLGRYLIAGEVHNKKGKLHSRVWTWDGAAKSKPAKLRLPKMKGIKNIEGITSIHKRESHYLLLVCDNGDREKKKGGNYVLLNIGELSL